MWLTPPGRIGVPSVPGGRLNGPELHRGPRLCVFVGVFSVPITDYRTREETEQGLSGLARIWGTAADTRQAGEDIVFLLPPDRRFQGKKRILKVTLEQGDRCENISTAPHLS